MDRFKLKIGPHPDYPISEKIFSEKTGRHPPYCVHSERDGKEHLFAVCPLCDNPIQIVGLYRDTLEAGRKPYGRHNKGAVPKLAEYDEEEYLNCPYSNPGWMRDGRANRRKDDPRAIAAKDFMRQHFDQAIFLLSEETGLYISYQTAREMLSYFLANEAWTYRSAREGNLPWVMAECDRGRPLFGWRIAKSSELFQVLTASCPEVRLEDTDHEKYAKIMPASNQFVSLGYCFLEHTFKVEAQSEHVDESIRFRVTRGQAPDLEEIYSKTIAIDRNRFLLLCQQPHQTTERSRKLLEIAAELIE